MKDNNMSLEALAKLGEGMQVLLGSEDTKKKLLQSLIGKNMGPLSTMPYYKEKFAERIKPVVDAMLKDKQARIVLYTDYPSVSRTTLYLQQQQAIKWLSDHVDAYSGIANKMSASKGKTGVVLRYFPQGIDETGPIRAHKVDVEETIDLPVTDVTSAINKIRNFLDSPKAGPLQISSQGITEEDMSVIETMLSSAKSVEEDNLYYRITDSEIKIVRLKDRKDE